MIQNIHRVSATAISATWTLECNYTFLGAANPVGVALRTSSPTQTTYASGEACSGRITHCSRTKTFADIAGTQTYQLTWDPDAYITFSGAQNTTDRCGAPNLYNVNFCQRLTVKF